MPFLLNTPTLAMGIFLLLAVGLTLAFEVINGFHDTANAVATLIYTHSLPATPAVVWSGLWLPTAPGSRAGRCAACCWRGR